MATAARMPLTQAVWQGAGLHGGHAPGVRGQDQRGALQRLCAVRQGQVGGGSFALERSKPSSCLGRGTLIPGHLYGADVFVRRQQLPARPK